MNKVLTWASCLSVVIIFTAFYLYQEKLVPVELIIVGVPFAIVAMYAGMVDSFWKKVSGVTLSNKELLDLVKVLTRHKNDERTIATITRAILSNEGSLLWNQHEALETLLATAKLRKKMGYVVNSINEATKESRVSDFLRGFKNLRPIKEAEDDQLIKKISNDIYNLFCLCGGYMVIEDVFKVLEDYLKNQDDKIVDGFLIDLEEDFMRHPATSTSEHQKAREAFANLMTKLRRRLLILRSQRP